MSVLTCRKCNGIANLLSVKRSKNKKIIKLICPKCKNCWRATVSGNWEYKNSLIKEKNKRLNNEINNKQSNEETTFGILLKEAIKKSERK